MNTAWVLVFFLWGQVHTVSFIYSEEACHKLAETIAQDYRGVDAANVRGGKCYPYEVRYR